MAVAWALNTWGTNSWVGMNAGPPNAWRGTSTPLPIIDTHDADERKHRRKYRDSEAKRRQDVLAAFDGLTASPEAEVVSAALSVASGGTPNTATGTVDKIPTDYGRIDLQALSLSGVNELLQMWQDEQERQELQELLQIL